MLHAFPKALNISREHRRSWSPHGHHFSPRSNWIEVPRLNNFVGQMPMGHNWCQLAVLIKVIIRPFSFSLFWGHFVMFFTSLPCISVWHPLVQQTCAYGHWFPPRAWRVQRLRQWLPHSSTFFFRVMVEPHNGPCCHTLPMNAHWMICFEKWNY